MRNKREKGISAKKYRIVLEVTVKELKKDEALCVIHYTNEYGEGEITLFPKNESANFVDCYIQEVKAKRHSN